MEDAALDHNHVHNATGHQLNGNPYELCGIRNRADCSKQMEQTGGLTTNRQTTNNLNAFLPLSHEASRIETSVNDKLPTCRQTSKQAATAESAKGQSSGKQQDRQAGESVTCLVY